MIKNLIIGILAFATLNLGYEHITNPYPDNLVIIDCHTGMDAGDDIKGAIFSIVGTDIVSEPTNENGDTHLLIPKNLFEKEPNFIITKKGFRDTEPTPINIYRKTAKELMYKQR